MTTNDSFDRRLSSWLERDAAGHVPDHLDEVLLHTAATRQRPWWSSPERWLPMDLTTRANAVAAPVHDRMPVVLAGPDEEAHGVFGVLIAVPEPATWATLAAGLLMLMAWRRRHP